MSAKTCRTCRYSERMGCAPPCLECLTSDEWLPLHQHAVVCVADRNPPTDTDLLDFVTPVVMGHGTPESDHNLQLIELAIKVGYSGREALQRAWMSAQ